MTQNEINDKFDYPGQELARALDNEKLDYCEIGRDNCRCGWVGEYPVSGCPECHTSFTN